MLLKRFRTRNHKYLYDANTNRILRTNDVLYDLFEDRFGLPDPEIIHKYESRYSPDDILAAIGNLRSLQRNAAPPAISFGITTPSFVRGILDNDLEQLILELTDRCNLRCRYCSFSGSYKYRRKHGTSDMSEEVLRLAIDYYFERSKKPVFGFYGGEPLLRFDLIRRAIEYARKIRDCRINITTNLTLLSLETVRYLAKNDINLQVSLDGPRQIHNRYRRFGNAKPTYDIILSNLNLIKNYSPEYFKNNVAFNAVLSPPYNLHSVIKYFYGENSDKIASAVILSFIDPNDTCFFHQFSLEAKERYRDVIMKRLSRKYKSYLIDSKYNQLNIEKQLFDRIFYRIDRREMKTIGDSLPPLGTCFPGKRRLFVSVDGAFYMCERVGANFKIGDVYHGFDYQKIHNFLKTYERFFSKCSRCWAVRLCHNCFNRIRTGARFDTKKRDFLCRANQAFIGDYLADYCEIREENDSAFAHFDSMHVI